MKGTDVTQMTIDTLSKSSFHKSTTSCREAQAVWSIQGRGKKTRNWISTENQPSAAAQNRRGWSWLDRPTNHFLSYKTSFVKLFMHHAKLFGWPTTTWKRFRPCFVSSERSSTYSVSLTVMHHFYLWRYFLRLPSSSFSHSSLRAIQFSMETAMDHSTLSPPVQCFSLSIGVDYESLTALSLLFEG